MTLPVAREKCPSRVASRQPMQRTREGICNSQHDGKRPFTQAATRLNSRLALSAPVDRNGPLRAAGCCGDAALRGPTAAARTLAPLHIRTEQPSHPSLAQQCSARRTLSQSMLLRCHGLVRRLKSAPSLSRCCSAATAARSCCRRSQAPTCRRRTSRHAA